MPLILLASTTLAIGVIVYGLLWRESERLRQAGLLSAKEQASTTVENIGLTMGEIKTAVTEALLAFEGPDFDPQIRAWQEQDPLVTFAFSWKSTNPDSVTVFPETAANQGAQLLASRYANPQPNRNEIQSKSVSDTTQWLWNSRASDEAELASNADDAYARPSSDYNFAENSSVRQSIRNRSQLSAKFAKSSNRLQEVWTSDSTHWIHDTSSGESYWIGISRWNNGAAVTGAAIKIADLAPLFKRSFPAELVPTIEQLTIVDDNQKVVAQTGDTNSYVDSTGWISRRSGEQFSIGPDLPGWTLRMTSYLEGSMLAVMTSSAGIATGIVLVTLFATGIWLVWQTRASRIDAAQKVSFVSNVSHELKTPLTTIRMYSELLQTGRVSDEEKRNKYLDTISGESERLSRLVNNVLDFSRLDQGKAKLNRESQPLDPVLRDYLEMRQADLDRKEFILESNLRAGDEQSVSFDRDALCQILGNLIDNSLKYAKSGAWIRIHSNLTEVHAVIELSDKGPGLPRHIRKSRFKAFSRGDDSLTAQSSGFGLGLSIAQTLATEMGSSLTYSHPRSADERPTFILKIPRS